MGSDGDSRSFMQSATLSFEGRNSIGSMALDFRKRINTDSQIVDRRDSGIFVNAASVKLSLQYFRNGNTLRLILHMTRNLGIRSGSISSKVTLFRDGQEEKEKCLENVSVSKQTKTNQEVLFENNDIEDGGTWTLRVRVYCKRNLLAKKKCVGETSLSLDDLDLFMNTTCLCVLRPKSSNQTGIVCRAEDVQVISRDRSIQAYARVSICATDTFSATTPTPTALRRSPVSPFQLRRTNTCPTRHSRTLLF